MLLWNDGKRTSSWPEPIDAKIPPIKREDPADAIAFGNADKRGIGEIHWQASIPSHERPNARNVTYLDVQKVQCSALDHLHERILRLLRR